MAYFLTAFLLVTGYLNGKDFGTFGTTFPIIEEDFLMMLQSRINVAKSDNLREIKNNFIKSASKPKGTKLPKAVVEKTHYYDPTYTVSSDIVDHEGKVLVRKGTKFNPLDHIEIQEDLLFFDGNDLAQVDWALKRKGKFILVNGSPLDLEKELEHPFYFDQEGYLINKLEITSLPAKVSQEFKKLKIEEIPCH